MNDYDKNYDGLARILIGAYNQAAYGKGHIRHSNNERWEDQPIGEIGRMVGPGFNTGQAIKKITESLGMLDRGETTAAKNELLGAIVYVASVVALIEEFEEYAAETIDALGHQRHSADVCGC